MGLSGSRYCLFAVDTADIQEFPKIPTRRSPAKRLPSTTWDEATEPCLPYKDLDAPPAALGVTGDGSCLFGECWSESDPETFSSCESALAAAKSYSESGDFTRALSAYRFALAIKINLRNDNQARNHDAGIYDAMGEVSLNAGRLDDAVIFYEAATWLDSKNFEFWYKRGVVYQSLGRLEEAIGCFDRSLEISPNYVPAIFSLGVVHQRTGNYEDALHHLETLIGLEPDTTEALVLAAECYEAKDQLVEAISYIDRVLAEDPSYAAARNMGDRLRSNLAKCQNGGVQTTKQSNLNTIEMMSRYM